MSGAGLPYGGGTDLGLGLDVDLLARLAEPSVRENPFPLFRQVRELDPIHLTSAGFYLVSRHADAVAVLRRTGTDFVHPEPATDPLAQRHLSYRLRLNSLLGLSGHSHDPLRRALSPAFTPPRTEAMRPLIAQRCEELLDSVESRLRAGAEVDLNAELARPLAFRSIADLAGIPVADQDRTAELVDEIAVAYEAADQERLGTGDRAAADFLVLVGELAAERARDPRDDLVSALVGGTLLRGGPERDPSGEPPRPDADEELAGILLGVLMGGLAPVAAAICLGVRTLIRSPDPGIRTAADAPFTTAPFTTAPATATASASASTDDPASASALAFADELLRHDGIVTFTALPRIAVRDIELPGGIVPQGADVRVALAAANRDPAAFADPDRFDPHRPDHEQAATLSFSSGLHRCLAPGLARHQIATAVAHVGARLPGLTAAGPPGWYDSVRVRAIRHLPVTLAARPAAR